jgi:hypothetical protein
VLKVTQATTVSLVTMVCQQHQDETDEMLRERLDPKVNQGSMDQRVLVVLV